MGTFEYFYYGVKFIEALTHISFLKKTIKAAMRELLLPSLNKIMKDNKYTGWIDNGKLCRVGCSNVDAQKVAIEKWNGFQTVTFGMFLLKKKLLHEILPLQKKNK